MILEIAISRFRCPAAVEMLVPLFAGILDHGACCKAFINQPRFLCKDPLFVEAIDLFVQSSATLVFEQQALQFRVMFYIGTGSIWNVLEPASNFLIKPAEMDTASRIRRNSTLCANLGSKLEGHPLFHRGFQMKIQKPLRFFHANKPHPP